MNSLYKATTKHTFKEYQKLYLTLSKTRNILVISLIWVILAVLGILTKNVSFFVAMVIVPFFEYFSQMRPLKKAYYSNKLAVDAELEFEFYEDFFTKKSKAGEDKIQYSDLYKIIETKSNFYLLLARNQGYILIKNNLPVGLDEFLRTKKCNG